MNMSMDERRATPPWKTLDVPESELIVRGGSGKAMSVGEKDLFKVHNITEGGLSKAEELGGIPVPSLAIARNKTGFNSFGDISLVGDKGSFAKDPTFAADVYSPRFPRVENNISANKLKDIKDQVQSKLDPRVSGRADTDFYLSRIQDDPVRNLEYSVPNQAAYLEDIGKGVNPDDFVRGDKLDTTAYRTEVQDRINADKDTYNGFKAHVGDQLSQIVESKSFPKWNPNTATTKNLEYNLANAVKLMKGNIRGGEGFNYGAGNVRAIVAPQLKSLKQITDRRGKIVGSEEMPFIKEEFASRFENLEADLRDKMTYPGESIEEALLEYAKGDKSSFKGLTPEDSGVINSLLKDLSEAPTEYFEIKPQRAVDINEFYGAAVPEGTSATVIKQLEDKGLVVEVYKGEGRGEAISRLNKKSGGNIFFSGGGVAILYGAGDDKASKP